MVNIDTPETSSASSEVSSSPRASSETLLEAGTSQSSARGFKSLDDAPGQHFILFIPWIQEDLQKEKIAQLYKDFGMTEAQRDALIGAYTIKDNDEHYQDIFREYMKLFNNYKIARAIGKWFFENSSQKEAKIMLFDDAEPGAFQTYQNEVLNHPIRNDVNTRVSVCLPVKEIVNALQQKDTDAVYRRIANEVKKLLDQKKVLSSWKACSVLFINFILRKPEKRDSKNWLNEILLACSYHPNSRPFAMFIDADYKNRLEEYKVILKAQSAPLPKFVEDLVSDQPPVSARNQSLFGNRPSAVTGEISQLTLYGYQEELAGPAKQGKNSVICAPTGSGKTIVAIDIMVNHLRTKGRLQEVARAVFFVPTIPLVNQQFSSLNSMVGNEFCITKMSGDEKAKFDKDEKLVDILVGDIIVMTPQIFINMLSSPLKSQRIYLTDFTLFVFDECHHCSENHPYNVLMGQVRDSAYKPQVVGLTASVGSGKTKNGIINVNNTLDHIYGLCARLTATTISSVKDKMNIEELMERVPQPVDEFISVPSNKTDLFAHELALICDAIEEKMIPVLRGMLDLFPNIKPDMLKKIAEESNQSQKNGHSKTGGSYYHTITFLKFEVQQKLSSTPDSKLFVVKCLTLLNILYYTLKYNELFPAKLASKYLRIKLDEFEKNELGRESNWPPAHKEKLTDLKSLFNNTVKVNFSERVLPNEKDSENKPIMDKLKEVLKEQYHKKPDSRILIFVSMRRVGSDLADYLNECNEVVSTFGRNKVGYIASTNQAAVRYGQTANEQKETLAYFHQGNINILVATSVAEEGLDVTACNLVIKYNSVGSEKSLTQRKGRARAKDSKAILLALDSDVMGREYENVRKEYLMNICVQELQRISERQLKRSIDEKEQELKRKAENEKALEQDYNKSRTKIYVLLCQMCNQEICRSNQLFDLNGSNVICCNPDAWRQTTLQRCMKANRDTPILSCGKWHCQCGCERGTVIKYGGVFLPTLNQCFILKDFDTDSQVFLKTNVTWTWFKSNMFSIPSITSEEMRIMASSLFDCDQNMFKAAEENGKLNILEALKERDTKSFRANYAMRD